MPPVFELANPGRTHDDFGKVATDFLNLEKREMFATSLEINHDIGDMTFTSITGWREFETELDEDLDGSNNIDYVFNSRNPEENDFFSQETTFVIQRYIDHFSRYTSNRVLHGFH